MITVRVPASLRDRATLTVLSGPDPGLVLTLEHGESTLGRSKDATFSVHEAAISRHHARVVATKPGQYVIEDLGSKNGTFVNGRAVSRAALRSGDRVQLGPALLLRFALLDAREEMLQRRVHESSTRDSLTGLTSRRRLLEQLELEIGRGRADGTDTGMFMVDIDHLKKVNDAFGRLAGDQVLRAVAASARKLFRAGEVFGRYGGKEFMAVVGSATRAPLVALAERLRVSFSEMRMQTGHCSLNITVSVGVALWSECASADSLSLVALADHRMYAAKAAGRNGVCFRGSVAADWRA
jgi:two-component system cell cycle response regulator